VASCHAAPVAGPSFVDATERGRKIRPGARLWTMAVATFKSETYRSLRLASPTDEDTAAGATAPPGFIHLPRGAEAEWIKQLVAEQLVTVTTRRGFQKLEWQKLRERNEVLDCRVYARAAPWIAGADRWSGAKWRDLEDQLGPGPGKTDGHRAGDEPARDGGHGCARAARDRQAPLHLARSGQRMVEVTWTGSGIAAHSSAARGG
jgi:phage terminase large subunit GpA-like protein